MPDDALESVLRLVADGRLSAEEAGPILDALDARRPAPVHGPRPGRSTQAETRGRQPGRAIRLEVTENGRKVVNLRVPLALGRAALDRVPGLSEADHRPHPRSARGRHHRPDPRTSTRAPADGVRIVIE